MSSSRLDLQKLRLLLLLLAFVVAPLLSPLVHASGGANHNTHAEGNPDQPTRIQLVSSFYNPNRPESFRNLIEMMRVHPEIHLEMWSGLSLPGGSSRAPIIMSIAGETSPDIMESWFHIIRSDINQGFLYPLNEWIGDDKDGDGLISAEEAKWEGWKDLPELWRRVATVDGKVYGIPQVNKQMMGVLFRTDLVRNAGLDPNKPPQTWDEFYEWCMRLSDPGVSVPGRVYNAGQRAIAMVPYGFTWIPWMQAAGGSPIVQVKRDPATGQEHIFDLSETEFLIPGGKSLAKERSEFRASFDSPGGMAAAALYHKLRWSPWIVDKETGQVIPLTSEQVKAGSVQVDGKTITFTHADVQQGVSRAQSGSRDVSPLELLGRGDVAMMTWFVTDLLQLGTAAGVNPDLLSWFPFPSINAETPRVVQVQCHYATLATNVRLRSQLDRDRIWDVLKSVTDTQARDQIVERMVISGLSRFVSPRDLERLGYSDYLRDVPEVLQQTFRDIEDGKIKSYTEPYQGFWMTMDGALNREVLSLILAQTGENFDYEKALKDITLKANSGVMFARSESELDQYRAPARIIFAIFAVVIAVGMFFIVKSMYRRKGAPSRGMVTKAWLPWLLLLPALLLIGLWGYYPLLRGMIMAFQDYRIAGDSTFVGLDNFIALALDGSFWRSLGTTVYFVFLTMLLSFTTPIILAILLSEVPRGKIFFRTIFFLPQVTSGLVIALLWKMMYDPRPTGIFNQVVALLDKLPFVDIGTQSWLLDPKLAMVCVVLPTAWATAGIQSLIYLAALKSVPEDLYEACEIDSGGIWVKLRHITLPVLLPLIIINFVGAFIGTFQNMGNIFLLTFGGPGETTMVAGMRIWIEAYGNLRFSIATSMAWVLGACLIGFTFVQIQFLKRIEFRKSDE